LKKREEHQARGGGKIYQKNLRKVSINSRCLLSIGKGRQKRETIKGRGKIKKSLACPGVSPEFGFFPHYVVDNLVPRGRTTQEGRALKKGG